MLLYYFAGSGKQWGITWYRVFTNSQLTHKHELLAVSMWVSITSWLWWRRYVNKLLTIGWTLKARGVHL